MTEEILNRCRVCGRIIIKKPGTKPTEYQKKKTCGRGTKCYTEYIVMRRNRPDKAKKPKKQADLIAIYGSKEEVKQAKINIECLKKDVERRGAKSSEVKILSREEINRLYGQGARQ